jgi:hypothetical protein
MKCKVTDNTAQVWSDWLESDKKPSKATARQMVRELLYDRELDKQLIEKLTSDLEQIVTDWPHLSEYSNF